MDHGLRIWVSEKPKIIQCHSSVPGNSFCVYAKHNIKSRLWDNHKIKSLIVNARLCLLKELCGGKNWTKVIPIHLNTFFVMQTYVHKYVLLCFYILYDSWEKVKLLSLCLWNATFIFPRLFMGHPKWNGQIIII